MPEKPRSIFLYEDYRLYLKEYFAFRKEAERGFTHRAFAKRAGFSSSSFCLHVMDGRKNISGTSVRKLVAALGLEGAAACYFEMLVWYNQAKTLHDREQFFSELNRIRRNSQFYRVGKRQFILYSEWYFPVIRELAVYGDWHGDYRVLGRMVVPSLSPEKARKAVKALVGAGLLIYNEDGTLRQNAPVVSAENAPAVIVNKQKKDFMLKAFEAEEKFRKPAKYSSSATLSMSVRNFKKAKAMIDALRQQLLTMAMDDNEVDKVFQVNFQLFPLSGPVKKSEVRSDASD
jgi:uncharacterized protein (TIGR02147 family)